MSMLVIGLALFLGAHSISIINVGARDRWAEKIGQWPWKGIYSLVALPGFVLIVWGYGLARQDPIVLYVAPIWLRHVAITLLIFVFPLLVAAYLPGRIKSTLKHPMLTATIIWALAHLLVNGTLADLVLFGSFLVWALADRMSFRHRRQRAGPDVPPRRINDGIAIAVGLVIYGLFVAWLHEALIGVPVFR